LSGFFHPFLGLLAGESSSDSLIVGVMEAEIDSDVDAHTIAKQGVKVIQLHTGGMCHLDADMTAQGLEGLQADELDLVILENVGNPKPALLIPIGDE
jgi:hydrogenase nickel incorporation protein HypB